MKSAYILVTACIVSAVFSTVPNIDALEKSARHDLESGNIKRAHDASQEILKIRKDSPVAHYILSKSFLVYKDIEQSTAHVKEFLQHAERTRDPALWLQGRELEGELYFHNKEWDKALQAYTQALQGAPHTTWKAHIYHNIAKVKHAEGKTKEAKQFYTSALEIAKEGSKAYASILMSLALVYEEEQEYEKSFQLLKESEDFVQGEYFRGQFYGNLGRACLHTGRLIHAEQYLKQAIEIAHSLADTESLKLRYAHLSFTYAQQRNYKAAQRIFQARIELPTAHNKTQELSEAEQEYVKILEALQE